DNMQGDIHTLQGRIAAIRSWAYICQRPDWVLARDEMAHRARAVEAKLSDALHARLTERFVNRRTAILMKSLGQDPAMLPVSLRDDGTVCVEDEPIGRIDGFRFTVDPLARHEDRKMLLAAGEKALPRLLGEKARMLAAKGLNSITIEKGALFSDGAKIARLNIDDGVTRARIEPVRELDVLGTTDRATLLSALEVWLAAQLQPLQPLTAIEAATRDADAGSQARALLMTLIAGHGYASREKAGIQNLPKEMRPFLRRLGVTFGAIDIFVPMLLKPAPRRLLNAMGVDRRPLEPDMIPVIAGSRKLPSGYRPAGKQHVRVDIAEKLMKAAHETRARAKSKRFIINPSLAISTGLATDNIRRLLGAGGFRCHPGKTLDEAAHGPPAPDKWEWRPTRTKPPRRQPPKPKDGNAFAALADLVR
ncbi:MAG: helicase, partial [Pontixanthobacter sp.]